MDVTHDDVLQILKLLKASDVDYLEVQLGDLHLVASKSGVLPAAGAAGSTDAVVTAPVRRSTPAAAADTGPPAPSTAADASSDVDQEGLVTVTAPVVGVFYAAPEPGSPAFVEVGSRVEQDTTVGLIEVMKMFNGVTAGARGEVVRTLVGNEEFVEFGQPLLLIAPDEPEDAP